MRKPILVVMAAGMGSRYGGLKQIDPVDDAGHVIMDYSIHDAKKAGFGKVVFVIKRENEADFRRVIGGRAEKELEVEYVFQELTNMPEGFAVPEGRVKPWGTGHATMTALGAADAPFALINADDFYGGEAFRLIADYLKEMPLDSRAFAMVGYDLANTLTENGHVARGVCEIDENSFLKSVTEHTMIMRRPETGKIAYSEDDGKTWSELPEDAVVSVNFWGFSPVMLQELKDRFGAFLSANLERNPLKCEYQLPTVVSQLLEEGTATVKVLRTSEKWLGMTYKEDKAGLAASLAALRAEGRYWA